MMPLLCFQSAGVYDYIVGQMLRGATPFDSARDSGHEEIALLVKNNY
ncbi:MAG: hypothetical protein JJE04_19235 [Acidobacteriia bacterium]|nr:hypothetical protein [Terriglobia bacterium]